MPYRPYYAGKPCSFCPPTSACENKLCGKQKLIDENVHLATTTSTRTG